MFRTGRYKPICYFDHRTKIFLARLAINRFHCTIEGILFSQEIFTASTYHFFLSVSSYLSHKKSSHSTQPVNSVELNNKNAQSPSAAIREFVGTAVQRQHCPMDCSTAIQPTLATHLPMDSSAPTPAPIPTDNVFNLDSLLAVGEVLLVSGNYKSLQLPSYFWAPECKVFPPDIQQQIETDFDW